MWCGAVGADPPLAHRWAYATRARQIGEDAYADEIYAARDTTRFFWKTQYDRWGLSRIVAVVGTFFFRIANGPQEVSSVQWAASKARGSAMMLVSDTEENGLRCIDDVLASETCTSNTLLVSVLGGTSVVSAYTRSYALAALGWL